MKKSICQFRQSHGKAIRRNHRSSQKLYLRVQRLEEQFDELCSILQDYLADKQYPSESANGNVCEQEAQAAVLNRLARNRKKQECLSRICSLNNERTR